MGDALRSVRRQELVDAAWRCIARKGYRDLTVDDVCAEAGVSKGAFYGYFARKQDVLLALLDEEATRFDKLLARMQVDDLPAAEQLRRLTRTTLEWAADPSHVQVRADLWAGLSTDPEVRAHFAATMGRQRALLRSLLAKGMQDGQLAQVPANALASIVLALTDGLVLHGGLDPSAFRWANVYRALDVLFDGMRAAQAVP